MPLYVMGYTTVLPRPRRGEKPELAKHSSLFEAPDLPAAREHVRKHVHRSLVVNVSVQEAK